MYIQSSHTQRPDQAVELAFCVV